MRTLAERGDNFDCSFCACCCVAVGCSVAVLCCGAQVQLPDVRMQAIISALGFSLLYVLWMLTINQGSHALRVFRLSVDA